MSSRFIYAALAAVITSGCASTSTMGLARTLNKGAFQGWVAAEGGGVVSSGSGVGYPMVEGGIRVGASDRVELGARLGFSGIGAEAKFALLRPQTMESGLNLSLNPAVGFFGIAANGAFVGTFSAQLPVLFGIDFGGHELIFGPRIQDQVLFGAVSGSSNGSAAVSLLSVGGSVGMAFKLGPAIRILPEASLNVPFFATAGASGSGTATGVGVGGVIFQIGVGFLFGSANAYEPEPVAIEQLPPPANAPLPPPPPPVDPNAPPPPPPPPPPQP